MPARDQTRRHLSASIAATAKSGGPDDPRLPALRERLADARQQDEADTHIGKLVAAAPPLTAEQRDKLALLLRGGQ